MVAVAAAVAVAVTAAANQVHAIAKASLHQAEEEDVLHHVPLQAMEGVHHLLHVPLQETEDVHAKKICSRPGIKFRFAAISSSTNLILKKSITWKTKMFYQKRERKTINQAGI
jgi:hypothetical protein